MAVRRPRRRKPDPVEFDLANIRKTKRLAKRVVKSLEEIEKVILKFRSKPRPPRGSQEEREAALAMYREADRQAQGLDDPEGSVDR